MLHSYRGLFLFTAGLCAGLAVVVVKDPSRNDTPSSEILLKATSTDSGGTLTVATGKIDNETEGLYVLDSLTGNLYCRVLLSNGSVGGHFKTNVLAALEVEQGKQPNLLMVTGEASFTGRVGATRPARSVVHVVDSSSGKFATYSVMWNPGMAGRYEVQGSELKLLDRGTSRTLPIRGE